MRPGTLRAGVVRPLEEAVGEESDSCDSASMTPEDEPADGVDQDQCGQLAAGEDVVADADLAVGEGTGPLVDPLVAAADQDEVPRCGELARQRIGQPLPAESRRITWAPARSGLNRREEGFGAHHHPRSPAVRCVVNDPVAADAVLAQVVHGNREDAPLDGPADDRGAQRRVEQLGEEGDDVDPEQGA